MNEQDISGQRIMAAALQFGHTEFAPGDNLYSAAGMVQKGYKNKETGEPFDTAQAPFYFLSRGRIEECHEPMDIIDFMNRPKGVILPWPEVG